MVYIIPLDGVAKLVSPTLDADYELARAFSSPTLEQEDQVRVKTHQVSHEAQKADERLLTDPAASEVSSSADLTRQATG